MDVYKKRSRIIKYIFGNPTVAQINITDDEGIFFDFGSGRYFPLDDETIGDVNYHISTDTGAVALITLIEFSKLKEKIGEFPFGVVVEAPYIL